MHLELSGAWLILGVVSLAAAVVFLLGFTAMIAFTRADQLREQFPRSDARRPHVLRLAVMNPRIVFVTPRRSPLVWAWTEVRAAAFGVVSTLAVEAVGHTLPDAADGLSESVDDATDAFELDERLARTGRALTWDDLLTFLAGGAGLAHVQRDQLDLPPVQAPVTTGALSYVIGAFAGVMDGQRRWRRRRVMLANLAKFDEHGSLKSILESVPGPLAQTYLADGVDGLLHQVRGEVFDSLKRQLPRRQTRQLAKAYRQGGLDGGAAWMIENIVSYPELFREGVHAELSRQVSEVDSIVARIHRSLDQ